MDAPVAIDEIKKFIAERELDKDTRFVPKMLNQTGKPYPEKIAVIGGGPAGLSCAYYLAVKGYPVTVFEKEQALGGMLTLGIPSFRLEKSVINAEIDVLRELGVEFRTGVDISPSAPRRAPSSASRAKSSRAYPRASTSCAASTGARRSRSARRPRSSAAAMWRSTWRARPCASARM